LLFTLLFCALLLFPLLLLSLQLLVMGFQLPLSLLLLYHNQCEALCHDTRVNK